MEPTAVSSLSYWDCSTAGTGRVKTCAYNRNRYCNINNSSNYRKNLIPIPTTGAILTTGTLETKLTVCTFLRSAIEYQYMA
jgi:hypothetical protein